MTTCILLVWDPTTPFAPISAAVGFRVLGVWAVACTRRLTTQCSVGKEEARAAMTLWRLLEHVTTQSDREGLLAEAVVSAA